MKLKHFQNFPSFKKMQDFKTKVGVILDVFSFWNMLFSEKLKSRIEKKYIIADRMG